MAGQEAGGGLAEEHRRRQAEVSKFCEADAVAGRNGSQIFANSKARSEYPVALLSRCANQIKVTNLDAFDYLQQTIGADNSLVYLDPPYFVKGHKLYKNFYQPADHLRIATELQRRRKSKWVVSYDDVPEIRAAYSSFAPITYLLNYSAGEKSVGSEVIFLSDALLAPKVQGFSVHHLRRIAHRKRSKISKSQPKQIRNHRQVKRSAGD
jgi:DNA adenine methylase